MKKISVLMLMGVIFLSGCETNPINKNNVETGLSRDTVIALKGHGADDTISYASGVRWNDDYVVTVKHFDGISENKVCKAKKIDLAFFKSPKEKKTEILHWSEPHGNSEITMVGFTNKQTVVKKVEGIMSPGWFLHGNERKYRLVSNLVSQGMSGGPAINSDGDIVGLIIGYTDRPVLLKGETERDIYSVILPYSSIQNGWNEVQEQIKSGHC